MRVLSRFVGAIFLLTLAINAFGQTKQQPKTPDQFAEVVLRVEGMT